MPEAAAETRLKAVVRRGLRKQLDSFLLQRDPESGMLMIEVLSVHAAQGAGLSIGVSVQYPEEQRATA